MKIFLPLFITIVFLFAIGFCQAQVVINEVMYHGDTDDLDDDLQWIELYNLGTEDMDISGWIMADHPLMGNAKSRDLVFVTGTFIPAGGYLLLVNDLDDSKDHDGKCFTDRWTVPSGVQVIEYGQDYSQLSLDHEGDDLHLSADGQKDIDAMWYGDGGEVGGGGAPAVAAGSSLGRSPNGSDSNNPAVDFAEFTHATPGASNQSAPVAQRSTWSKIKLLFR